MQIQPNAFVTLECQLKDAAGERLDEGDDPIEYVHGYCTLVPGLESALVGLKVGDVKEIVVPAKDGFGERDDELVLEVDRSEFPKNIEAGDEFVAESEDGEEVTMRIVEIKGESVIVDANHPFAGQTLYYHVRVAAVREASDKEIEIAATAYEAAREDEHVHDESCGHAHDEHGAELIQLGKKAPKKAPVLN